MARLINTELPIVAAPMAGGASTVDLAKAVIAEGGFAFLAGGYKTPDVMHSEIGVMRGTEAFGVNLFVPQRDDAGAVRAIAPEAFAAYRSALAGEAAALGVELPVEPINDDDIWHGKLDVLTSDPVPVVSLTFGLPPVSDITALQRAGSIVLATVTSASEALEAEAGGVDGLLVQGPRAGGHSATFDPGRSLGAEPTADVVAAVRTASGLPMIAAGGVDGSPAVAELLRAGAQNVAVGTLLLAADEAGTSAVHRAALADPQFADTVITRTFTGRPARALRNDFTDRFEPVAPIGYPAIHHLTRELRQAAAKNLDPHRAHLWAGTGYRNAIPGSVGDILRRLVSDL